LNGIPEDHSTDFTVTLFSTKGTIITGNVRVTIKDSSNAQVPNTITLDNDMRYQVTYKPTNSGVHTILVAVEKPQNSGDHVIQVDVRVESCIDWSKTWVKGRIKSY
jgi:hypothetical protein